MVVTLPPYFHGAAGQNIRWLHPLVESGMPLCCNGWLHDCHAIAAAWPKAGTDGATVAFESSRYERCTPSMPVATGGTATALPFHTVLRAQGDGSGLNARLRVQLFHQVRTAFCQALMLCNLTQAFSDNVQC